MFPFLQKSDLPSAEINSSTELSPVVDSMVSVKAWYKLLGILYLFFVHEVFLL